MKKKPFVTLEKLQEITEKYPTPFHLYDEKGIRENANALKAAEAFREGGQFAKNRARIAKAFGLINLLRFRFGWWSLKSAFRAISRRFGVKVEPLVLADGAYAIDVDNERTYGVAEILLKKRKDGI